MMGELGPVIGSHRCDSVSWQARKHAVLSLEGIHRRNRRDFHRTQES
jgi:hypothetical protein